MELGSVGIAYMEKVLWLPLEYHLNWKKEQEGLNFHSSVWLKAISAMPHTGFYFLLYHHLSVKAQTMLHVRF